MPRNSKIGIFVSQDEVALTLMILHLNMREEMKKERSERKLDNLRKPLVRNHTLNPTNRVGGDNSIVFKVTVCRGRKRVL